METNYDEEIWKPIKGYEEFYEVSNLGRVRSLKRLITFNKTSTVYVQAEKFLTPQLQANKKSYQVQLSVNSISSNKGKVVGRLVMESFLNVPYNHYISYKDKDICNCSLSNISIDNITQCNQCGNRIVLKNRFKYRCDSCCKKDYYPIHKKRQKQVVEEMDDYYTKTLLKDKGFEENSITKDLIKVQKLITKTKRLCKALKI